MQLYLQHIFILLLLCFGALLGCNRLEEEISNDAGLRLSVSTDTVTFDTLFSTVGSTTKRFKVFNTNENAINISSIRLGLGGGSAYTITVNGVRGTSIQNEVILGNDSLLVLVDVLIDPADENLPFLVKDSVIIDYNTNSGNIKLVAWGQDAHFVNAEFICDETWKADKPYIIYNYAIVDTLCTLTVEAGTRIYIDNDASFFVKGSLKIRGSAENKVIIRNTRLDAKYDIAPGQWNSILFLEGSKANVIDHAEIRNGSIGLRIGTPDTDQDFDVSITNTSIAHMSQVGILTYNSDVYFANVEVFNCQQYLVANLLGGYYQYEHCTFSNFPSLFSREGPSVVFADNVEASENEFLIADLEVSMTNSIIWGKENEEIGISQRGSAVLLEIKGNIIRSEGVEFDEFNNISLENNYPGFFYPENFDYQIDSLANARNAGSLSAITHDLLGTLRDSTPDLGAYERKDSIQ